jgi:kinesin family protein 2/24
MGGSFEGRQQQWTNGIYALTASDVFDTLKRPEHRREGLYVVCSFFEIYSAKVFSAKFICVFLVKAKNFQVFDLLGKKAKLQVLEDGKKAVQIVGLKEMRANSVDEVYFIKYI